MRARSRLVDRLRVHLLRQGLPRFEMLVIVCGTGLAGFAASVLLLAAGITSMALRYPLAVLIAPAGATASGAISDLDVDETWVIVLPIVMIGAAVLGAVYVVSAAPVLMAEVLLDVLLVSGLYRRLRKLERHSWLRSAFRRTWIPVLTAAVIVAAAGFTMQVISPQADTLGDVLGAGQDGPPSQR